MRSPRKFYEVMGPRKAYLVLGRLRKAEEGLCIILIILYTQRNVVTIATNLKSYKEYRRQRVDPTTDSEGGIRNIRRINIITIKIIIFNKEPTYFL